MEHPSAAARQGADAPQSSEDPAAVKDVAAWVTLLLRTVKTCRLYDAGNAAVARFRTDLAETTDALLDRLGSIRLEIQSASMLWQEHPVFQAHSREDNLSGVFHRDGVRALTFLPGIAATEVQSFVDVLLHVTGPSPGDDDLVTLLWEANLPHVEVSAVPLEGDVDGGEEAGDEDDAPALPWPSDAAGTATTPAARTEADEAETFTRSDDWGSVDGSADPETVYEDLETAAAAELEGFRRELADTHAVPLVTAVAQIIGDAVAAGSTPTDRAELARFIPRVLREAIAQGEWGTAAESLRLLRECAPGEPMEKFLEGITVQGSPVTRHAVAALDRQGDEGVEAFIELARGFGAPAAQWLMHVLAESQQRRTRQPLVTVLAELVREQPDVLLPWLSDERWYVVRNVVHIFSQIGGGAVGGFVEAVAKHPEPRVRREVIEVLAHVEPETARPLLRAMLEVAEPRLYATILQRLAQDPAEEVTAVLLQAFDHEAFSRRTEAEQRAILMALAVRGDSVLPALEAELQRGGLFARGDDATRRAVAFCTARIGTPAARALLERVAKSGKGGARAACTAALQSMGGAGE